MDGESHPWPVVHVLEASSREGSFILRGSIASMRPLLHVQEGAFPELPFLAPFLEEMRGWLGAMARDEDDS